ncbi:hypothetical protein LCGC14_1804950, partial [marine sediment metagenome]
AFPEPANAEQTVFAIFFVDRAVKEE